MKTTSYEWLDKNVVLVPKRGQYSTPEYRYLGAKCSVSMVPIRWKDKNLSELANILCAFLSVDKRITYLDSYEGERVDAFNVLEDAPATPIHALIANDEIEQRVSRFFRRAFGTDLILNRGMGIAFALHCGDRPIPDPGSDRVSLGYVKRLSHLPTLGEQGHGMRSFAGCVVAAFTSPALIHLIDEPEAFLHPTQARLLGRILVSEKPIWRQTIIATHSGDLLRGVIDGDAGNVSVIRLTRDGNMNHAKQLSSSGVREVWSNPILRYSNVLDGLFHESVVVCEAEGDCKFYTAVLEAITRDVDIFPDTLFTSTGGKQRLPDVAGALVALGVKTRVVADFDILREEQPMRRLIEALGGVWLEIKELWSPIRAAIEQKLPPLTRDDARKEIDNVLGGSSNVSVSRAEIEQIQKALRKTSIWDFAKHMGSRAVPPGMTQQQLRRLLARLRDLGLFVVDCGEMEGFVPTIGGHGTLWVAEVMKRDLARDPELEAARRFVRDLQGDRISEPANFIDAPEYGAIVPSDVASNAPTERVSLWSRIRNRTGI